MAANRDRQRALARAKLERQMARRAAEARRRRRIQAGIAAGVAVLLAIGGVVWLVQEFGGSDKSKDKSPAANASKTPAACEFKDIPKKEKKAAKDRKDVGVPKAGNEVREGVRKFTLKTNQGTIEITLDAAKAPCNTESLTYLAGKKFWDNTPCHRLTTQGLFVLQCGDPTGTGRGGPTYSTNDENLPIGQNPAYPKGAVAMANSGPGTNGSQFFIVYKDTQIDAAYTIVGSVTAGIDVVDKIAKAGVDGSGADGKPKKPVKITTATVGEPLPAADASPTAKEPEPSTEPSKS
ncbi:MAG: peptidylprolyl isomerase [Micromonosporaceae bacterium]